MRRNFGPKTWLFPMPVLMIGTYDENGNANIMNAAWGGIFDTDQIAVCIDPAHKTAKNMLLHRCFTVSIGDADHAAACDYVGIVSGSSVPDKAARAGFSALAASEVYAPVFKELPMALECRLISFDEKKGCATADIVNVSADESILTDDGKISLEKFFPICFDPVNHDYRKLGDVVGKAFSDGKRFI